MAARQPGQGKGSDRALLGKKSGRTGGRTGELNIMLDYDEKKAKRYLQGNYDEQRREDAKEALKDFIYCISWTIKGIEHMKTYYPADILERLKEDLSAQEYEQIKSYEKALKT